ncbi:MAG: hypothetical protein GY953_22050, partial [bacterium]|nr:hypothetical protein [bacterium]
CMFCHNGYPELPEGGGATGADPVFEGKLPEGIDCQRCHGPGRDHVEAAGKEAPVEEIRQKILNPKNLPPERQLEVCMQCHLETTTRALPFSLVRFERTAFSYRPSEPLSDFMYHFDHAPGKGPEDKFEIAHAAYRLRMSACFEQSGGDMTCTTCHDPHRAPRGEEAREQYTAVCLSCHQQPHTESRDCLDCHMPKRRTDDVIHVVMTDHYIQRNKPKRGSESSS